MGSGGIYTDTAPLPFFGLDLNPTEAHSPGVYASGIIATVYVKPTVDITNRNVFYNETVYHNYTGSPSGVYDFPIASVTLVRSSDTDDVEIVDTRTRGGGLNKEGIKHLEDVDDLQPEAQFFWDRSYFDGKAIPGNGVIVVDVPKRVLESNGGVLTEDEVRSKIQKHMALGVYAIINYI